MSSCFRFIYAECLRKGEIIFGSRRVTVGPSPLTLLFEDRDRNTSIYHIDERDTCQEWLNVSINYFMQNIVALHAQSNICLDVCDYALRGFKEECNETDSFGKIQIQYVDAADIFRIVWCGVKDRYVYFDPRDCTVYGYKGVSVQGILHELYRVAVSSRRVAYIMAIPLMCRAVGDKDTWNRFRDLYTDSILNDMEISKRILNNFTACAWASNRFRIRHADVVVADWFAKLDAKCESSAASSITCGAFKVYKLGSNYIIRTVDGDAYYTFDSMGDLESALDSVNVTSVNTSLEELESYLLKSGITSMSSVLAEVDRLLRLSGDSQGLDSLKDVLSDIK